MKKSIHIKNIFLDSDNPRHDPTESQPEAIKNLVKDENIRELAADIVKKGVNPVESVILLKSNDDSKDYIVLEGNRRVCALKLLYKPTLCPDAKDKKYYEKLKKEYEGDFKLESFIVESRDDAEHWILLKHGTGQGGAAAKTWDSTQTSRFIEKSTVHRKKHTDSQSYLLMKYAVENKLVSKKEFDQINITTITRYISNPPFRESIGVKFNDQCILTNLKIEKFNEVISRFLLDGLKKPEDGGLSSRSSAKDRKHYGETLLTDLDLVNARLPSYEAVSGIKENPQQGSVQDEGLGSGHTGSSATTMDTEKTSLVSVTTSTAKRPAKAPSVTVRSLINGLKDKTKNLILKKVIEEFIFQYEKDRSIACLMCLRAVLETQFHEYLKVNKKEFYHAKPGLKDDGLQALLNYVYSNLNEVRFEKNVAQSIKNLKNNGYIVDMNQTSHGNHIPNKVQIDEIITNSQALIELIFSEADSD